MKHGNDKESQGGYTIEELANMWQKYVVEITLGVVFTLTAIFSLVWSGAMLVLSILLCMILGALAVVFPDVARKFLSQVFGYINLQEKIGLIVALSLGVILAIFLPCVIFAIVGIAAGSTFHYDAYKKLAPATLEKVTKKEEKKKDDQQKPPQAKAS